MCFLEYRSLIPKKTCPSVHSAIYAWLLLTYPMLLQKNQTLVAHLRVRTDSFQYLAHRHNSQWCIEHPFHSDPQSSHVGRRATDIWKWHVQGYFKVSCIWISESNMYRYLNVPCMGTSESEMYMDKYGTIGIWKWYVFGYLNVIPPSRNYALTGIEAY